MRAACYHFAACNHHYMLSYQVLSSRVTALPKQKAMAAVTNTCHLSIATQVECASVAT
jgi:hypothetical protein